MCTTINLKNQQWAIMQIMCCTNLLQLTSPLTSDHAHKLLSITSIHVAHKHSPKGRLTITAKGEVAELLRVCWAGGLWQHDDGHDLKSRRLGWHWDAYLELSSLVRTKEDWSHVISLALGTSVSLEKEWDLHQTSLIKENYDKPFSRQEL